MRRTAGFVIGFLALAGLIGFVATGGLPTSNRDEAGSGGSGGAAGAAGLAAATGALDQGVVAEGEATSLPGSVAELPGVPSIGASVVRTASLAVEVKQGRFDEAFDSASLIAGRYGGYVQSSSTAGTDVRSGDLLIRVPSDRFDEAMSDLRALGTVERQSLSGEDVSAQFVDLEARLVTWEAQEGVLLRLMSGAASIEATLRVQRELQDVQLRIEQLKGQLRLLEDRTDFATIQVALHETGAPIAKASPSGRPSLAEAWDRALDGFLGVAYAVVVGLGYLIPLSALAGLAVFGYRRVAASSAGAGRTP